MPIENFAIVVVGLVALVGLIWGTQGEKFKKKATKKGFVWIVALLLVYSLIGIAGQMGYVDLGEASGAFLAVTPAGVDQVITTSDTPITTEGKSRIIDTLKATQVKQKGSNSFTTVGGTLYFYPSDVNPSDSNANAIDSITISSGVGSSTNGYLNTNTPYRVVFDGSTTYYDKDFGIVTISEDEYNPSTGTASFEVGEIITVATITDILDESNSTDGSVNGNTAVSVVGTNELANSSADELTYDESVGDATFYIKPTLAISGAYSELKDAVLCFEGESATVKPEGTEVTSLTYTFVEGNVLNIDNELVNYWANEECISIGNLNPSFSSQMKLTFTVDETALDANDDFLIYFDDLGGVAGKDVLPANTGATLDSISFDSQA